MNMKGQSLGQDTADRHGRGSMGRTSDMLEARFALVEEETVVLSYLRKARRIAKVSEGHID